MANIFPRWTNYVPIKIAICIGALAVSIVAAFEYYGTPKAQRVGYMPDQPIPYDHELHVNQLGLDCRHCHSFVEKAGHSNIPVAQTCANCHHPTLGGVKSDSPRLKPLIDAIDHKKPIRWVKVHALPDYAYFNHSAHINRGVSCVECHGRVDQMRVVYHAKSLSMGMCIECHRAPEKVLRPLEQVFNLKYTAREYLENNDQAKQSVMAFLKSQKKTDEEVAKALKSDKGAQQAMGSMLKHHWNVQPKESCFTCHR